MRLTAHQTHELNSVQGALQQSLDGKKGTSEWRVMVTMVTKTSFKTEFKTGFKPKLISTLVYNRI